MKKLTEHTIAELQQAFANKFAERLESEISCNQPILDYCSDVEEFFDCFVEHEVDELKDLLCQKMTYYKNSYELVNHFDWRD